MMDWVLTDEEITEAESPFLPVWLSADVAEFERAIARAQNAETKRKLVEWLNSRWRGYEENRFTGIYRTTFAISSEEWQALKQETGLE